MKYEITIRQLEPYTPEEEKETNRGRGPYTDSPTNRFSDKNFHEMRVLYAEVSKEEFEAVKKAIIGVF